MYFSSDREAEFSAIALISLDDYIEDYVPTKHYDTLSFLKEFTPMIEALLRTKELVELEEESWQKKIK